MIVRLKNDITTSVKGFLQDNAAVVRIFLKSLSLKKFS